MKIMKKYSFYSLCVLVLLFQSSCLFQEDEKFNESAAQRMNHALAETEVLLADASNGWIMEYFPANDKEGYTFLMKFTSDGKVVVATKNKYTRNYTEEAGVWEMIGDNGPVLSFNTFINIFHIFADPRVPGQDFYDGMGLGGDYEFMVLQNEANRIRLKGKKRATDIVLKRMAADQNWEEYFTKLEQMEAQLFNSKLAVTWTLGSEEPVYDLNDGFSRIFRATPLNAEEITLENDEIELDFNVPFIVTDYGFRLAQPLKVGDISVQSFRLSENKDYLYAEENANIKITGVPVISTFLDESIWTAGISWTMNRNNVSDAFSSVYEKIINNCKEKYDENFNYFALKNRIDRGSKSVSFQSGRYEGGYDFDIKLESGTADRVVLINKNTMDNNGNVYLSNVVGFAEMLDLLSSTSYTLSSETPLCPTVVKFVSTTDNNKWFILTAN